jgi:hypothetical protein
MNIEPPKSDMVHLGPNLTPSAEYQIGSRGAELRNPRFMSNSISLFCFQGFFDRATARTTEPTSMVDGSNDVFSRKEVPFGGHVTQNVGVAAKKTLNLGP